jgi:hypothetical protein
MVKRFTWERPPFEYCPKCTQETLGLLSAGGDRMILRCTECRHTIHVPLPELNKKTIYLDQFVFSALFKLKGGGRPPIGQHEFYQELEPLLRRVVLLQQAILPHSDVHSSETIVFSDARGLREAYESLGEDVSLKDTHDIEINQVFAYAAAFRDEAEPQLNLVPDEVLDHGWNEWLPDMRITVNGDYSMFAEGIRRERDHGFAALKSLFENWANEKPSFGAVLRRELRLGAHKRSALAQVMARMTRAQGELNVDELLHASLEPIWREFRMLTDFFQTASPEGNEAGAVRRVGEFWDWPRFREMPFNQISANLFAGLGRRVAMGQRKFTRGIMNDIRTIAAYAPYVDAMFIDRECAELLSEEPLRSTLSYRAKIFSYSSAGAFLDYLRELDANASQEIRQYAQRIYGFS